MDNWLIVASARDASAGWARDGLLARGHPCELLSTESLASADVRFYHRVFTGEASVEITLPQGRRIQSGEFSAVLNRAASPPFGLLARMEWADSAYARSEEVAFALSWITALAPVVVNPPSARGLSGAYRSTAEWRALAHEAGMTIDPLEVDSHEPVAGNGGWLEPANGLVIGERVFGVSAGDSRVSAAAVKLSRAAGTPILGLLFADGDATRLTAATAHPDLAIGGEAGLTALAGLLSR